MDVDDIVRGGAAISTWYSRTHGPLGLIWLDTNFHRLLGAQRQAQLRWANETTAGFDSNARIRGIVFFTHQPVWTNSDINVVRADKNR